MTHRSLSSTLWSRYRYYPHFINEEVERNCLHMVTHLGRAERGFRPERQVPSPHPLTSAFCSLTEKPAQHLCERRWQPVTEELHWRWKGKVYTQSRRSRQRSWDKQLSERKWRGAPWWLSWLSLWLRLISWFPGLWVPASCRALCWQLRAWSLFQILCLLQSLSLSLSLSLWPSPTCTLCPSLKNKYTFKKKKERKDMEVTNTEAWRISKRKMAFSERRMVQSNQSRPEFWKS